jgi:hypothetical protein
MFFLGDIWRFRRVINVCVCVCVAECSGLKQPVSRSHGQARNYLWQLVFRVSVTMSEGRTEAEHEDSE